VPRADHDFDDVLLSRVRLGIVTVLISRPEGATFPDLKDLLGTTQGNLGVHLQKLEEEGYVTVKKDFVRRKPRTTARLTGKGRAAFLAHVEHLARIAREGK
jgi:DNA-binding MarR family transcriptional regulator